MMTTQNLYGKYIQPQSQLEKAKHSCKMMIYKNEKMLNPLNEFRDKKLMQHLKVYKGCTLNNFKKDPKKNKSRLPSKLNKPRSPTLLNQHSVITYTSTTNLNQDSPERHGRSSIEFTIVDPSRPGAQVEIEEEI